MMCLVVKLYSLALVQAASEVCGNEAEERRVGGMHVARDKRRNRETNYSWRCEVAPPILRHAQACCDPPRP